MFCFCGKRMKCLDSRKDSDNGYTKRRWECGACGIRYTSHETLVSLRRPGEKVDTNIESHELHKVKVDMLQDIGRRLFGTNTILDIRTRDE
jgi:transcriptional regulator NrdR family protein